MALIQATRRPGTGSGGLTITGWRTFQLEQTENFTAGSVILTLPDPMADPESVVLTYNGQVLNLGLAFSVNNATTIQILFADPYVTDYDSPPIFQAIYPYTT